MEFIDFPSIHFMKHQPSLLKPSIVTS